MDKEVLNKTLEELKMKAENYQRQIELRVLDNCPFILEVGALTIGLDEIGKVITQNTNYPTQFTQKAVDEILTMNFKNENEERVVPKVYGRTEWYSERLNDLKQSIKLLKPLSIEND